MELKEYQQKALEQVKRYLELLSEWRKKAEANTDLEIDFPLKAWEKAQINGACHSRKNGLGQPLPNFCLKIPTGGGKTLLAAKTIDLINAHYLKKRTGLVLWVVPTTQIYRQILDIACLKALRKSSQNMNTNHKRLFDDKLLSAFVLLSIA